MSEKNFVAYGDAESILTGYANRIKQSPTTFVGTQAQWNALSSSQKAEYELVDITDDSLSPSGHVDWESNGKLGAKNLLPFDISHIIRINGGGTWNGLAYTYNGVTYTLLSDGTVRVNGTATAYSLFRIIDANSIFLNPSNDYYITGSPSSSTASTYYVYYSEFINGSWVYYSNLGDEDTLFTPNITATQCVVDIVVRDGQIADNVIFKPMLRLATDSDSTYQPYAMTNQQMTPYVQAISNPNLLDNPWFTVNQRAKSSYSGPNYAVDRWGVLNDKGTLTVNADGSITITASGGDTWLRQKFESELLKKLVGKAITVSIDAVKTGGNVNLYSGYYDASNTWHRISEDVGVQTSRTIVSRTAIVPTLEGGEPKFGEFGIYIQSGQSVTIYSTKLELGSVSTLAMDTAPNYATELLKCQRYFYAFNGKPNLSGHSYAIIGTGYATSANNIRVPFYLPVEMRIVPTVSVSALSDVVIMSEVADAGTPSAIAIDSASCDRNNIGLFNITSDGNFVKGHSASVYTKNGCRIDLSADL